MSPEVIATVLTGVGVLVGVWRLVEGVRRDLTAQIAAVHTRIDDTLSAARKTSSRQRPAAHVGCRPFSRIGRASASGP